MGVFRLTGQPKRDNCIIVRSCKASQWSVYPIRDAILAVNHASCPSLSPSAPCQWGESALKTSRLPGARSPSWQDRGCILPQLGAGDNRPIRSNTHHRSLRSRVHSRSAIFAFRSPSVTRMSFTYFRANHEIARRNRSIRISEKPARKLCETSSAWNNRRGTDCRPDVVLFVNGLPLGIMELKNPADEDASIWTAWRQLQTA